MKKNLLTVLILALLIVNIALTSVMMFSVMGVNKKTADLVTSIATVLNLELTAPGKGEPEVIEVAVEDMMPYNVEGAMTIPLKAEEGKNRYISFNIGFVMDKSNKDYKKYGETIGEKEMLIKSTVTTVVSQHTEQECRDDAEGLKIEILKAVQEIFQSEFIFKVAISDVKFGSAS